LYNVKILWDDGSETYEPLEMVIKDDPVTLAAYARKNKLLEKPVWKKLKTLARRLVHDPEGVHHLHYNVMAKLCVLLHTKMQTSTMTWSLEELCLVFFILSTRHLLSHTARNRRL
jgi:hypothetical protein